MSAVPPVTPPAAPPVMQDGTAPPPKHTDAAPALNKAATPEFAAARQLRPATVPPVASAALPPPALSVHDIAAPRPARQAPAPRFAGARPLSQSFAENLRRVYGHRTPQDMAAGASFGYIVD